MKVTWKTYESYIKVTIPTLCHDFLNLFYRDGILSFETLRDNIFMIHCQYDNNMFFILNLGYVMLSNELSHILFTIPFKYYHYTFSRPIKKTFLGYE